MTEENLPEIPRIILYPLPSGKGNVTLTIRKGQVWVTQSQIAKIFGTSVANVSQHIARVLKEGELSANSVIKQDLITADDGKDYSTYFYSLDMVLAVGFAFAGFAGSFSASGRTGIWRNISLKVSSWTTNASKIRTDDRIISTNCLPAFETSAPRKSDSTRKSAICSPCRAITDASDKATQNVLRGNTKQANLCRDPKNRRRACRRPREAG
jgi:hypothetical protein